MNANDEASVVYYDSRDRFDRSTGACIALCKSCLELDQASSKGLRELVRNLEGALREARAMERWVRRMEVGQQPWRVPE